MCGVMVLMLGACDADEACVGCCTCVVLIRCACVVDEGCVCC